MTTLKLHYDGWLALPAALRRELGLDKGAALEVELVDGTIVLRPSDEGRGSAVGRGREATEAPVAPRVLRSSFTASRHAGHAGGGRGTEGPGPDPARSGLPAEAAAGLAAEGGGRAGAMAPLPVPAPLWELRRKADRPVVAAGGDDPAPVPDRRPARLARVDKAVPLGLAANKFVTNSFKYAFAGGPAPSAGSSRGPRRARPACGSGTTAGGWRGSPRPPVPVSR